MLAEKFYSDEFMTNNDYAIIGGIDINELNLLEREFLALIHFDLYITEEEYKKYFTKLRRFENSIQKLQRINFNN